jgi:hypothetical protein
VRSKSGFFAALAFLLAAPAALLVQMLFGSGAETVIHFMCGLGFALSAFAVFDFTLPGWINGIGFVANSLSAVIWLLQGLSNLVQNNALNSLAFRVLGQRPESWAIDLFILWLVALLFVDSQGKTRLFGLVVMSLVVIMEIYRYGLSFLGGSAPESLKLLYLLAIVWFLLESLKRNPRVEKPKI